MGGSTDSLCASRFALRVLRFAQLIPYSAKFSRRIIFAVFTDRPPSAKILLRGKNERGGRGHFLAAKRVTNDLTAIHSWCRNNHLLINQTKTLAMFLSRNNTKQRTEISQAAILLDGSPLRTVSEFRYLGVLLDSDLSFKNHINYITSRAYGALCTLRKSQTYLPLKTRKLLYRSLVLPHLEYCTTVWDPCTKQMSDQIERVQNRAMRSYHPRQAIAYLLTISQIRTKLEDTI